MKLPDFPIYINGSFTQAENGQSRTTWNPANGVALASFAWADAHDAHAAVTSARHAFDHGPWRDTTARERHDLLLRLAALLAARAEEFALWETRDAGALLAKSRTDVALGISQLRYFASMALRYDGTATPVPGMQRAGRGFAVTVREAVGVCAQIIPWNFPLTMAIWKLGPALATGNTAVLKCAPETPVTALLLAQLCHEAGFPPGVVNIITGGSDVGETLASHPLVDKIAFTGSTATGRRVLSLAAQTLKNVTLECGGKSANLILDDADPALAVDGTLYGCFFHAGQVCESGTRLLLSTRQHDTWLDRLVARTQTLRPGDPEDPATTLGPLISERQLQRVQAYIDSGVQQGARLQTGGQRLVQGDLHRGWYMAPTLFSDVDPQMRIAQEEIFGPVLSVLRYRDIDHAVQIANDSPYGLAAGVWSRDLDVANAIARRLRAGWVWINEWHLLGVGAPFGGYRQSGIGREFGEEGLNAYTEIKTIYQDDIGTRQGKPWYDILLPEASSLLQSDT